MTTAIAAMYMPACFNGRARRAGEIGGTAIPYMSLAWASLWASSMHTFTQLYIHMILSSFLDRVAQLRSHLLGMCLSLLSLFWPGWQ